VPISANLERDFSDFEFEVLEARRLAAEQRDALLRLFEANYERANPAFLDRSLAKLRRLALAYSEGACVGFALAETRDPGRALLHRAGVPTPRALHQAGASGRRR